MPPWYHPNTGCDPSHHWSFLARKRELSTLALRDSPRSRLYRSRCAGSRGFAKPARPTRGAAPGCKEAQVRVFAIANGLAVTAGGGTYVVWSSSRIGDRELLFGEPK
ncbi:uncharacterized protein K489DRAFT_383304 [Dissoconium aciculare CBS 342.82]|uniref:Uncharacterized protein n=1 Tax=Dissoconium aciculare CBS 342.82 TaxID=1314786 RepID=A0A6J3LVM7_9PEZI|nr:uncharacterized protein K489DRAFT_383304 [Dissoconium aciculare CBS 342.82]KAF1819733.1 hypothetical protein K489DRAFT_383304 [Dissoconium aciculare CBS 342.82]